MCYYFTDQLDAAFKLACKEGTKEVFNARMNLVGHREAGKTSLATRLIGEELIQTRSTEGVNIYHIRSAVNKQDSWEESNIDTEGLIKDFSHAILARSKKPSTVEKMETEEEDEDDTEDLTNAIHKQSLTVTPTGHNLPEPLIISDGVKEEIHEHEKTFLVQESEEVTPFSITLWDLGGQNEFMATHHLFLNVETTSLIVMDITKSLDDPVGKDPKSGHPNSAVEILRYWLNAFQVEIIQKNRKPNIAIVLTHKDVIEATKENPEEYIQNYIDKILEQVADYPEFVTRENIYVVDNKTGTESDFEKLRSQLLVHLTKQGTWGMKMPLPWLKLKADIIKKGNEIKRKYLDLQEVEDLAVQYGMKENDVKSFLQKQNILGDFIFYSDSELNDNVIIDPQWLVSMCSALITTNEFLDKKKSFEERNY